MPRSPGHSTSQQFACSMNATIGESGFSLPNFWNFVAAGITWLVVICVLTGGFKASWFIAYQTRARQAQARFGHVGAVETGTSFAEASIDEVPERKQASREARQVSRRILNAAAGIMITSTILSLIFGAVFMYFGLPFGVITVPAVLGITVSAVACGDPTAPRFVRELAPFAAISGWIPVVAGSAFLAVLDVGSMLPEPTLASRVVFSASFALIALVWAAMLVHGCPVIFPAPNELLARISADASEYSRVLEGQRAAVGPGCGAWRCLVALTLFPIPAHLHLLEGAGFFQMPVREMIRRCLVCARVAWLATGVATVAMTAATHGALSATFTWGGLLPTGLAFLALSFVCTPAGHRRIRGALGRFESVDAKYREIVVELLSVVLVDVERTAPQSL